MCADVQRREDRSRRTGGIGAAVILLQCGRISQVMPVEVCLFNHFPQSQSTSSIHYRLIHLQKFLGLHFLSGKIFFLIGLMLVEANSNHQRTREIFLLLFTPFADLRDDQVVSQLSHIANRTRITVSISPVIFPVFPYAVLVWLCDLDWFLW